MKISDDILSISIRFPENIACRALYETWICNFVNWQRNMICSCIFCFMTTGAGTLICRWIFHFFSIFLFFFLFFFVANDDIQKPQMKTTEKSSCENHRDIHKILRREACKHIACVYRLKSLFRVSPHDDNHYNDRSILIVIFNLCSHCKYILS